MVENYGVSQRPTCNVGFSLGSFAGIERKSSFHFNFIVIIVLFFRSLRYLRVRFHLVGPASLNTKRSISRRSVLKFMIYLPAIC